MDTMFLDILSFGGKEWYVLALSLLGILEIVVRLTPTDKDNSILTKVSSLINFLIPNNAKEESENDTKDGSSNFLSTKKNHK